jgi:hypothetical protein
MIAIFDSANGILQHTSDAETPLYALNAFADDIGIDPDNEGLDKSPATTYFTS